MTTNENSSVRSINPSTWNAGFAYDQAQLRPAPTQLLTLAGQGPVSADGELLHVGDMAGQVGAAFDNVEQLLELGGMTLADVLSMTVYVTDVDAALGAYGVVAERLRAADAAPPATLVGVTRLAIPGMQVEITVSAGR
jgi:enamine deaminase RidA (YjgF/YER057c/UK114 family)